jgi:TrmH family RNA methyltransferase
VAEGPEVVRSALDAGVAVESLFLGAGAGARPELADLAARAHAAGARVFDLAPGVLERVADTVTPQPVLAVVAMAAADPDVLAGGELVVVLADVRDPGNVGTLIRSADAAGVRAVLVAGTSVDPYNPKAVRASAGSVFHVPVLVEPSATDALARVATYGYRTLGATAVEGHDYATVDWTIPTALVLGNEADGLGSAVLGALDGTVAIPMAGRAESLNVGTAGAVLCFEALRQRRLGPAGAARDSTMPGMPEAGHP